MADDETKALLRQIQCDLRELVDVSKSSSARAKKALRFYAAAISLLLLYTLLAPFLFPWFGG